MTNQEKELVNVFPVYFLRTTSSDILKKKMKRVCTIHNKMNKDINFTEFAKTLE